MTVLIESCWGMIEFLMPTDNEAPRQKQPQISPIFKADTVRLHVSREKDWKLRLVDAGWDDAKVVQPGGCGQARRGVEGGSYPLAREARLPPSKIETPQGPPFF